MFAATKSRICSCLRTASFEEMPQGVVTINMAKLFALQGIFNQNRRNPIRGIQGWEYLDGLTYQHLWMSDNVHGYLWMHRKKLVSTVTNPARFPWNLVLFHVIHRQLVLPHILLQLPEGRLGANRILPSKRPIP
jgi:hypothetical protein